MIFETKHGSDAYLSDSWDDERHGGVSLRGVGGGEGVEIRREISGLTWLGEAITCEVWARRVLIVFPPFLCRPNQQLSTPRIHPVVCIRDFPAAGSSTVQSHKLGKLWGEEGGGPWP